MKAQLTTASATLLGVAGAVTLALVIEIAPRTGLVDPAYLPPLSTMLDALLDQARASELWSALGQTMRGWAIGLLIASVVAVAGGLVIGSVSWLREMTGSTIEFLRPIPSVALVPLVVLIYGTAQTSTIVLVVYATVWPILIQVLYGVQDVDPVAADTARSFRFGKWGRMSEVVWPTALPYVMTGLRLGATIALILQITGEMVIGTPGLGQLIALAQSSGAVPTMYALLIVAGLIGVLINAGSRLLAARVMAWHPSVRRESAA